MAGTLGLGGLPSAYAQKAPTAKPAAKPTATAPATGAASGSATAVDAKKAYGDGEKKFKAGDYAGALADFKAADSVKETPQAARYIGLCEDNLQHYPEAVTAYERFLANVPAKLAAQGTEIKARVDAIKAMNGKVHVETDPKGATILVDGKPQGTPTPTDLDVAPGHHTLKISADGREDQSKDIDVTYASKQDVAVTLPAKAAPAPVPVAVIAPPPVEAAPPPPPVAPPPRSKLPAIITGGLAVAAAGVGTVFGVLALGDKSDYDKTPTSGKADDGENHALIADMAFGVAITLGVTSAVLFLSNDDPPPAAASNHPQRLTASAQPKKSFTITPTPIITPHGGGAGALVRF
jgi:hypothetical protein